MTASTAIRHGKQTLPTLGAVDVPRQLPFRDLAARSHAGHMRLTNQDHFLMLDVERSMSVRGSSLGPVGLRTLSVGTLIVVADGMGGHTNGELASAVAIDTIAAFAARSLPADRALGEEAARSHVGFQNAARECQRRIDP